MVRDHYHLNMIVTIPQSRGQGIGGMLIDEMLRQAREAGKSSSLTAHAENTVCLCVHTTFGDKLMR